MSSLLAAAFMAAAVQPVRGQAFQMSMEDSASWGGMIVVAVVDSIERTRTFESEAMTCLVVPFSSLRPHEDPLVPFEGIYTRLEPGIFFDEDGNQSIEWPLVTGSGYEDLVEEGDTAIVFLRTGEISPGVENRILRMEPMTSVQRIVDHIVETSE